MAITPESVKETFDIFAVGFDHTLSAADAQHALRALGFGEDSDDTSIRTMVRAMDSDATGKISFGAFETTVMRRREEPGGDAEVYRAFKLVDRKGLSKLGVEDIKASLPEGFSITSRQMASVLRGAQAIDGAVGDEITYDQWKVAVK